MTVRQLETDYLVVGGGLSGLTFVDALVHSEETGDVDFIVVDRRGQPGGHWTDCYPFVRLHQPSVGYGVSSLPVPPSEGPIPPGDFDRAAGPELVSYFRDVLDRLVASGRVRWLPNTECIDGTTLRSRSDGSEIAVAVRRSLVDATYVASEVPETYSPPFETDPT